MLSWLSFFATLPAPLATALVALIPSVELSVALPLGVLRFQLPVWQAYLSAVAGSFTAALIVFALADPVTRYWRSRLRWVDRIVSWVFARTRGKFTQKYERYGELALLLLVAFPLPLPFSGAWSASLAAWLFGIPQRRALPLIALGLLFAGGIMVAITLSGSALLNLYLQKP